MDKLKVLLFCAVILFFWQMPAFAASEAKNFKQAVISENNAKVKHFFNAEKEKNRKKLVNNDNIEGTTPLIYAVSKGNAGLTELLLSLGADINATASGKKYQRTALMEAIAKKNPQMAAYLLDKGALINFAGGGECEPFTLAVITGQDEIVKMFEDTNRINRSSYDNAFATLIVNFLKDETHMYNRDETFAAAKKYLSKGASVNTLVPGEKSTLLHAASNKQDSDTVAFLIENGADVNARDILETTPLMQAKGNLKIIKMLTEAGAAVNTRDRDGKTPLMYAVQWGSLDAVKYLAEQGADIYVKAADGATAMSYACGRNLLFIKYLEEAGANFEGAKILSQSVKSSGIEITEYVLSKGITIKGNSDADEALLKAAENGNFKALQLLVEGGAKIDAATKKKETPLLFAAQRGDAQSVKYLLKNGANFNAKDADDTTVLMYAVKSGKMDLVEAVVAAGAYIGATDKKKREASYYAKDYNMQSYLKIEKEKQEKEFEKIRAGAK